MIIEVKTRQECFPFFCKDMRIRASADRSSHAAFYLALFENRIKCSILHLLHEIFLVLQVNERRLPIFHYNHKHADKFHALSIKSDIRKQGVQMKNEAKLTLGIHFAIFFQNNRCLKRKKKKKICGIYEAFSYVALHCCLNFIFHASLSNEVSAFV